jgi:hypothetical protein
VPGKIGVIDWLLVESSRNPSAKNDDVPGRIFGPRRGCLESISACGCLFHESVGEKVLL